MWNRLSIFWYLFHCVILFKIWHFWYRKLDISYTSDFVSCFISLILFIRLFFSFSLRYCVESFSYLISWYFRNVVFCKRVIFFFACAYLDILANCYMYLSILLKGSHFLWFVWLGNIYPLWYLMMIDPYYPCLMVMFIFSMLYHIKGLIFPRCDYQFIIYRIRYL